MGRNPWKFYVVTTPSVVAQINERTKKPSYNAPVLVFTTTVGAICEDYDVALAHENMCIAATALGVGSIILHYNYPADSSAALREILHVPADEKINFACVALGYAAGPAPATPTRAVSAVFV
eukprot:TRINITY_DN1321_c0_g1_i5.p2 TRINITY_DN1321_c0_g1~~TRINITY_DN1321_c0_g1_i5.p2  ORF type:complete len:122 (+),score=50.21 TRINITY_DN1321_c0_g1_i5:187-552(+)